MNNLLFRVVCCGLMLCGTSLAAVESPYGICAHISRGEFSVAPQELELMRNNGIGWVRADFDWKIVEPKQGQWDYSRLDAVVELADKYGIRLLPILDYDVPWASPAWKHQDKWLEYVSRTVTRYKGRLSHWEIWNEENSDSMWRDKADAENYLKLVKNTYSTIKKIDPQLKVVLGGTAGIPMDYIEKFLKAGGGSYFDVMNIHPYRHPNFPEKVNLYNDMIALKKLMNKYGVEKDIWITEIGWPTQKTEDLLGDIIDCGLKAAGLEPGQLKVAVIDDPEYNYGGKNLNVKKLIPGAMAKYISLPELARLDPGEFKVLLLPPAESFPMSYFAGLENYVKNGGTVIFWRGVPLYYDLRKMPDGGVKDIKVGEEFRQRLHLGWEAWWTVKNVPNETKHYIIADEFKDKIRIKDRELPAGIFLTASGLHPGDRMTQIMFGEKNGYKGCVAALYQFNSDLKGKVIAIAFKQIFSGVGETVQAEILPRAYLLGFQAGVKKIFWYELQSTEFESCDQEAHFGLLHRDLSTKPGFDAYSTLTAMRPAGSANQIIVHNAKNVYLASWERPDGVKVWAVWSAMEPVDCVLNVNGSITQAVDFLGKPRKVSLNDGKLVLKAEAGILYLAGPSQISLDDSVKLE